MPNHMFKCLSHHCICNSYNMGKRDLPDIYLKATGPRLNIRKILSAYVMTNIFHFRLYKNLPKVDLNILSFI